MEYRIPIWKGLLIRHFREAANRTQAELSELLERDLNFKYDSNSISRLERDDVVPNRLVVERIAHALKIPPVNFCDSAEIKEFLDGQRVPGPGAVGNEPDSGEPQIAYDVNELISNYESMPSRYAELDLTLVFENAGWYAAEVNEVVELGLSRGATVTGVICVVAAERTHLKGFASDEVGELLRGTAEKARVEARVRTLYGTIVDPDSWIAPPDTSWKEIKGLQIKEIVRICPSFKSEEWSC